MGRTDSWWIWYSYRSLGWFLLVARTSWMSASEAHFVSTRLSVCTSGRFPDAPARCSVQAIYLTNKTFETLVASFLYMKQGWMIFEFLCSRSNTYNLRSNLFAKSSSQARPFWCYGDFSTHDFNSDSTYLSRTLDIAFLDLTWLFRVFACCLKHLKILCSSSTQ